MISFLCKFRPRSVQAKYAASYKKAVVNAYKAYYAKDNAQFGADLYGIAYYFHKRPTELDADNLSKPIWDALENVLYENDRRIKLRYAGLFDIHQPGSVTVLDTIDSVQIDTNACNVLLTGWCGALRPTHQRLIRGEPGRGAA